LISESLTQDVQEMRRLNRFGIFTFSIKILLAYLLSITLILIGATQHAVAATYFEPQTNFEENEIPLTSYNWNTERIDGCIYKEDGIPNSYYVWTKLAVQSWRQALREYTENYAAWNISARHITSLDKAEKCNIIFYIYDSYKDFPDYPNQTGAYTVAEHQNGAPLLIHIYLSPVVIHADGHTEIDLPSYAFRNSAIHETGHALGLGHMNTLKGYLMSPQFDFWEQQKEFPITTLELSALVKLYGEDGFA
jgi:hypothetical protein